MKIKTLFKTLFCIGLLIALCLYLLHIYGNYIEQTQQPITDYTYNGYQERSSYKNSNVIFITYKSKQYTLHGKGEGKKLLLDLFPLNLFQKVIEIFADIFLLIGDFQQSAEC